MSLIGPKLDSFCSSKNKKLTGCNLMQLIQHANAHIGTEMKAKFVSASQDKGWASAADASFKEREKKDKDLQTLENDLSQKAVVIPTFLLKSEERQGITAVTVRPT